MVKYLLALSLLVVGAVGAPAATKFLKEASEDLGSITQAKIDFIQEKSAAVAEAAVAVADVTREYSGPVVDAVGLAAKNAASSAAAAAGAAVDAGSATIEYISNIDPIEVLNKTEESLVDGSGVVIHNVFDAKRTIVNVKKNAIQAKGEIIGKVANVTTASLEAAATQISSALAAASKAVSDAAAEINSENLNATLRAAGEAISDAGATVGSSLVSAKEAIHDAAKDFDSKKLLENKHTVIGKILSTTADQAERFADDIGLFSAIDSVVHGIAAIPGKVGEVVETIPGKLGAMVDKILANEKTVIEENAESQD